MVDALEDLVREGCRLASVVLTHHHRDHVDGVEVLRDRFDVELLAHAETAAKLPDGLDVDRRLEDGETLDVDPASDHRLEVFHTPGHAPGHLCLLHRRSRSLIAGDLVASTGTILIDPPEGHMGRYLASLERMNDLELRAILPAHGTVVADPHELLAYYLEHRREREQKVLEALRDAGGAVGANELVEEVYDDVPASVWPIAVRSLEAHLIHLVERSRAEAGARGYRYVSSSSST